MIYPFVANKVEQLELDPTKKINGYVWYNTIEKVYKTWVDDKIQIFITDSNFEDDITEMIETILGNKKFTFTFTEVYGVTIRHNKGSKNFVYKLFDTVDNVELPLQMEILNDNEVKIDFVDPVSGYIVLFFE